MSNRRDFLLNPFRRLHRVVSDSSTPNQPAQPEHADEPGQDEAVDLGALAADFSYDTLQIEAMRLGVDPAGLTPDQLLQIVAEAMRKQAPGNSTTAQMS